MKELTIEQKAKRYDEVLAMAQECVTYIPDEAVKKYMLDMFPELKEPEGERVRKAILKGLIDCRDAPDLRWTNFGGITIDECIAWLEKQGNKPTNCVVPHKYNVGDWIVSKYGSIYQVKAIMNSSYNLLCASNIEEINSISQVDNLSRLLCMKDIQDMLELNKHLF